MFHKFLKDFKHSVENKGDELVVTIKGDKEKVAVFEKKLKAIHELCGSEDGVDCCSHCC